MRLGSNDNTIARTGSAEGGGGGALGGGGGGRGASHLSSPLAEILRVGSAGGGPTRYVGMASLSFDAERQEIGKRKNDVIRELGGKRKTEVGEETGERQQGFGLDMSARVVATPLKAWPGTPLKP